MEYDEEIISDFVGEYSDAQLEIENVLEHRDKSKECDNTIYTVFRAAQFRQGVILSGSKQLLNPLFYDLSGVLNYIQAGELEFIV